jgi:hypothetical protein
MIRFYIAVENILLDTRKGRTWQNTPGAADWIARLSLALRQREHDDAVAALEVQLIVAACGHGNVLLAVYHVRDRR